MFGDGKTVMRASYGIFFDHPMMALVFDSVVADGTQAPQILLFGGNLNQCSIPNIANALNAANAFAGRLGCLPAGFTYLPGQQRFDPTPNTPVRLDQPELPHPGTAAGPAVRAAVRISHGRELQVRLLQPG